MFGYFDNAQFYYYIYFFSNGGEHLILPSWDIRSTTELRRQRKSDDKQNNYLSTERRVITRNHISTNYCYGKENKKEADGEKSREHDNFPEKKGSFISIKQYVDR